MASKASSRKHPAAPEGASIVVIGRVGVLMVQRGRPPFGGRWSFPGGRAEQGEEAETTARRELLEETGLGVGPLLPLGTFSPAPEHSPLRLTVFAARADPAADTPRAGDDALRAEFVPFARVLALPLTPGAAGWIARAIAALSKLPTA